MRRDLSRCPFDGCLCVRFVVVFVSRWFQCPNRLSLHLVARYAVMFDCLSLCSLLDSLRYPLFDLFSYSNRLSVPFLCWTCLDMHSIHFSVPSVTASDTESGSKGRPSSKGLLTGSASMVTVSGSKNLPEKKNLVGKRYRKKQSSSLWHVDVTVQPQL